MNGTEVFRRTIVPGIERTLHVATPWGLLEETGNTLSVSKIDGGAVLVVSEMVVFFQRII